MDAFARGFLFHPALPFLVVDRLHIKIFVHVATSLVPTLLHLNDLMYAGGNARFTGKSADVFAHTVTFLISSLRAFVVN